ncbi:hypothetical protein CALVIDRAFT_247673 [Calocera viscosa TUFC12733]|uniref:Secreted protein n=1 Tax=Calocera viscosa (strain TUFC12733) TaxID=1330018 RepID=A0A167JL82_CALVF|nr:hypothetical protein CALVIDRAFT_247673 [Calocera viscosa TUFC12733]
MLFPTCLFLTLPSLAVSFWRRPPQYGRRSDVPLPAYPLPPSPSISHCIYLLSCQLVVSGITCTFRRRRNPTAADGDDLGHHGRGSDGVNSSMLHILSSSFSCARHPPADASPVPCAVKEPLALASPVLVCTFTAESPSSSGTLHLVLVMHMFAQASRVACDYSHLPVLRLSCVRAKGS